MILLAPPSIHMTPSGLVTVLNVLLIFFQLKGLIVMQNDQPLVLIKFTFPLSVFHRCLKRESLTLL